MRMILRIYLPLLVLLGAVAEVACAEEAASAIERMKKDLFFLAGDVCEGRGPETEGLNKAAQYIADRFKELGLKPGGVDGTYFQPFTFGSGSELGSPNAIELTNAKGEKITLELGKSFNPHGMSASGKVSGGLVFVGYGIDYEPKKYNDYAGLDVAGKIVVVLRKTPRVGNTKEPFVPEADYEKVATYENKLLTAAKYKAAGVLFVNDAVSAKEEDSLVSFNLTSRGGTPTELPVGFIKREVLEKLIRSVHSRSLSELEGAIDRDLKPASLVLGDWKAELTVTVKKNEFQVKNVLGVLPGEGPLADEYVILGAHYDHLGGGGFGSLARGVKATHYGADDNGSGTTSVLELARRFAERKEKPARTLIFMLFSAEERGLIGSAHYCNKQPLFPLDKTIAMINLDMVGRLDKDEGEKKGKLEIGGVGTAKNFEELIDKLNAKYGFEITKNKSGVGPSDHASFYPKKIPVFFFFTGIHVDYHKPSDTPDKINYVGMNRIVNMVEELTTIIVADPKRPEYVAGQTQQFRPVRQEGRRVTLGFIPGSYDESEAKGALVGTVRKDGPADKAGIKDGDFIIELAGKPVKNMIGYTSVLESMKPGETYDVTVMRGDKKLQLKVTP